MPATAAAKLPPVEEAARAAALAEESLALIAPGATVAQFLDRLLEAGRFGDATRLLAFALPKREAVWWGCRCARIGPPAAAPEAGPALEAAERWVIEPTEANRRAAGSAGEAAATTPAGCAALGAFWSGGSLAPEGLPAVAPAEDLTSKIISACAMLAGVIASPEKAPERYREFIDVGLAIAEGRDRWPDAADKAPAPAIARPSARPVAPSPTPTPPPAASPPPAPASPSRTSRFRDTWE